MAGRQTVIRGAEVKEAIRRLGDFMTEHGRQESDRAFVVISIAKIDNLLEQLLLARLLPNPSGQDPLFDGDSALSPFSAKINLSYRLGIIGADLSHALHTLRKIRNAFAHEVSGCDLNRPPHRDRVDQLVRPMRGAFLFEQDDDSTIRTTSVEFRRMVGILIFGLESMRNYVAVLDANAMTVEALANVRILDDQQTPA